MRYHQLTPPHRGVCGQIYVGCLSCLFISDGRIRSLHRLKCMHVGLPRAAARGRETGRAVCEAKGELLVDSSSRIIQGLDSKVRFQDCYTRLVQSARYFRDEHGVEEKKSSVNTQQIFTS